MYSMLKILFVLGASSLFLVACSSPPKPTKQELAAQAAAEEAKKFPTPPTIFSHTMTRALASRMERVRYSPSAVFQLRDCDGCWFVYDQTTVTESGVSTTVEGITVENPRFSEEKSIVNKFGYFQGGALTAETAWASVDIVKFCYHNLRICKSEDPSSCVALNPKLRYELNLETGSVNTNLPVTDPNLRLPASTGKRFKSICPSLRKAKAPKAS